MDFGCSGCKVILINRIFFIIKSIVTWERINNIYKFKSNFIVSIYIIME